MLRLFVALSPSLENKTKTWRLPLTSQGHNGYVECRFRLPYDV